MEKAPKTRDPLGTWIVVKEFGNIRIARLDDWIKGGFPNGQILRVALNVGPLKAWIRAYNFREKSAA